jgi:hypothetical protein
MHLAVDRVLVLTPDRELKLVTRRRQVQRPADPNEWASEVERRSPLDALGLDLRLLTEAFGIQECRDAEAERENDDTAGG